MPGPSIEKIVRDTLKNRANKRDQQGSGYRIKINIEKAIVFLH